MDRTYEITKFPIKSHHALPKRGVVLEDVLGIYRATELRRCVARESEGTISFDAELPVYLEEYIIVIALPIPECDDYLGYT